MRFPFRSISRALVAGLVLGATSLVQAQTLSANYELTVPSLFSAP